RWARTRSVVRRYGDGERRSRSMAEPSHAAPNRVKPRGPFGSEGERDRTRRCGEAAEAVSAARDADVTAVVASRAPATARRLRLAGWLALAALLPPCLVASVVAARAPAHPTGAHERCLRAFPRSRDASCLADVVFGVRAVGPRIDELARLGLAAFRERPDLTR